MTIEELLGGVLKPITGSSPHAGYHGSWRSRNFFEGWYFRVTLPLLGESFAFMYSIEDPGGSGNRSGGMMQVLGPGEELLWRSLPDTQGFWANPDRLALGHWGRMRSVTGEKGIPGNDGPRELSPQEFGDLIEFGYQVSDRFNQGHFLLPSGEEIRWLYRIESHVPYGWPQPQATMGWLSYLPVFEPGWQILMVRGRATGYVQWRNETYEFERVPVYAEKNWGGAFPLRWFWMQCNTFEKTPDLTFICVGGIRKVMGCQQSVGMVSLQWGDRFVSFMPEDSRTHWTVNPWGRWEFGARTDRYRVEAIGHTEEKPVAVMVPTAKGMKFNCWDTTKGDLQLRLWELAEGSWKLILEENSNLAGLEIGGDGWASNWVYNQR